MSAKYHFVSTFRIIGDPERVWQVLSDVEGWGRWWRSLERSEGVAEQEREPGDGPAVGSAYLHTLRSPFGYRLRYEIRIVGIHPQHSVDAEVSGDLVGRGRAVADTAGDEASIRFLWLVAVSKPWMRRLSPIARPAFTWAHRRLMADFGVGFTTASGARLVSIEHVALRPGDASFWEMPE
jgi:hypothetical protein